MTDEHVRTAGPAAPAMTRKDQALTAAILAFFGMAWFGWGHDGAPGALSVLLDIGSVLSAIVLIIGLVLFFRSKAAIVGANPEDSKRYGIVVGIEFTLAGIGAALLGASGHADWIPVWILAVVAIHFFPLTKVLHNPHLPVLAWATLAVTAAALVVGLETSVKPAVVTGAGGGVCLLVFALGSVVAALRPA